MNNVTQREEHLSHSKNPIVAETAKDLLDARADRTQRPPASGPAIYSVIQEPDGFEPRKYLVERRVPLVGGGHAVTVSGHPTDDPKEAEMLAFSAAMEEPGARAISYIAVSPTCEVPRL